MIGFFYIYTMEIKALYEVYKKCVRVETDTRKDLNQSLFFALKGDNFNGNEFAARALDSGALYAVVDEEKFKVNDRIILVDNVLHTLQELANYHRKQLKVPVISLTGSNGKTTTKELIHAVLREKYVCTATKGNLNNHIGVPLTLLTMTEKTEISVVEMGANHPGEIDLLCKIAEPDYGFITNFGRVHLEGFGSLEGVIHAKTELYRDLAYRDKIVFVNGNDPVQLEKSAAQKRIVFGTENSDYPVAFIEANPFVKVRFNNCLIESKLIGKYNFPNIAAAVAIGLFFGVEEEKIKHAVEQYIPSNNRSQIIEKATNRIILDAYNANPNSMQAALENLAQLTDRNKVAILGDMFEIGSDSAKEHQHIADLVQKIDLKKVYLIGQNFSKTEVRNVNTVQYSSFEEFKNNFKQAEINDATVLIKASRGMSLERVLELI